MVSEKKRLIALVLALLLGVLGAHRFYVKKYGTAILQIVTLGFMGIWTLIDVIFILCGSFTDKKGSVLRDW